jgi:hypothetical protein
MARLASRIRTGVVNPVNEREALRSLRYYLNRLYLDENNAVKAARKAGISWDEIGTLLGISGHEAETRYTERGIY